MPELLLPRNIKAKWLATEGLDGVEVLRLSVLRELHIQIHREKSVSLAGQSRMPEEELMRLESGVLSLIHMDLKNLDVDHLTKLESGQKAERKLPDHLFESLPKEKLMTEIGIRFDRRWEVAILGAATAAGWSLYSLETEIPVSQADQYNRQIAEDLWPTAIPLFVEAASASPYRGYDPTDKLWTGKWYFVGQKNGSWTLSFANDPQIEKLCDLST